MSECDHRFADCECVSIGCGCACTLCGKSDTQICAEKLRCKTPPGTLSELQAKCRELSDAGTFSVGVDPAAPECDHTVLQKLIDAQTQMNDLSSKKYEQYMEMMARQFEKALDSQVVKGLISTLTPYAVPKADGYGYRMQRYGQIMDAMPRVTPRILLDDPPPNPSPRTAQSTCAWCNETTFFGCTRTTCIACADALSERLYAGANDCPEERDSVRRWVDRQTPTKSCRGCTRPLEQDAHVLFCSDCAVSKPERVAVVTEEPSGWSAWATATDES